MLFEGLQTHLEQPAKQCYGHSSELREEYCSLILRQT